MALVILVLIVLILVITRPLGDAGGDSDSGPSAECLGAMETAAAELDSAAADPLIIATLSECGTADEWLAALEQHPGAMGLTERAEIGDFNLLAACVGQLETPVWRRRSRKRPNPWQRWIAPGLKNPPIDRANEDLRSVECFSSTLERRDWAVLH